MECMSVQISLNPVKMGGQSRNPARVEINTYLAVIQMPMLLIILPGAGVVTVGGGGFPLDKCWFRQTVDLTLSDSPNNKCRSL